MAKLRFQYYRQPPVKGGRIPRLSCLLPMIEQEIERLAKKHKASPSWVVATILADALNIKEQPSYLDATKLHAQKAERGRRVGPSEAA